MHTYRTLLDLLVLPRLLALLLLLGVAASPAMAQSFRCNGYVIDMSLHQAEIERKCGPPSRRSSRVEWRTVRVRESVLRRDQGGAVAAVDSVELERQVPVTIEEWVYNFGPQQFMQLLVFENGRVQTIRDLDHGG